MKNTQRIFTNRQLWLIVLVVIIMPIIIKESICKIFNLSFDNSIWHEIFNISIVLLIAIPIFAYLIFKSDTYAKGLAFQLKSNNKVNEELLLKNEELKFKASHDYLTGLPNRMALVETLDAYVSNTKNAENKLAVLFMDLDSFKLVNDTLGHLFGDQLIQQTAHRLNSVVVERNSVFRHGGDEFVILIPYKNDEVYNNIAASILDAFSVPFIVGDEEMYSTASLGISLYPECGDNTETLLKKADNAMYLSKNKGGNMFSIFQATEEDNTIHKMKIENGLRSLTNNEDFQLYYQPIINLKTKEIIGFEALIRWYHPELGFIPPNDFIPVAERTGIIIKMGKWVLRTACFQLKEWQATRSQNLTIAVNVSIRQIKEYDFVKFVSDTLEETKLSPEYLEIEITESMMQNSEELNVILENLKTLGVKISVDDFGTGFSSLSTLAFSPCDYLKIDQAFTRDMLSHAKSASIVKTIIDMGHNLDIQLIAEGIEYEEQAQILIGHGCQYGQGYHYSKPLPVENIDKLLQIQLGLTH